jgi:hypothetical protein
MIRGFALRGQAPKFPTMQDPAGIYQHKVAALAYNLFTVLAT